MPPLSMDTVPADVGELRTPLTNQFSNRHRSEQTPKLPTTKCQPNPTTTKYQLQRQVNKYRDGKPRQPAFADRCAFIPQQPQQKQLILLHFTY